VKAARDHRSTSKTAMLTIQRLILLYLTNEFKFRMDVLYKPIVAALPSSHGPLRLPTKCCSTTCRKENKTYVSDEHSL
jgi:hypothetical protein